MALQRDGTLIAWGNNDYGQRTVRAGLPWVLGVSAAGLRSLALIAVLPSLLRPPTSQTAETGSKVGFSVRAVGEPVLAYQWFFNGATALAGATNSVLQLTNVDPLQAGAYTVVVTNFAGAVTSTPAILSVIPPVQRRIVPALLLLGQPGSSLNLDDAQALDPSPVWATFDNVALTNTSQWYFDLSAPLPSRRFYRAWEPNSLNPPSSLNLYVVPASRWLGRSAVLCGLITSTNSAQSTPG